MTINDTTGGFTLSWNAASGTVTQYQLCRSTSSGSLGAQIYAGSNLTYTDTGLTSGTTYYYTVKACNGAACNTGNQKSKQYVLTAKMPTVIGITPNSAEASPTKLITFVITGTNFTPQMAYQIQKADCPLENKRFISTERLEMDCRYSKAETLTYSVKVSSGGADVAGQSRGSITFTGSNIPTTLNPPSISLTPGEQVALGTPMSLSFTQETGVTYKLCVGLVSGNYNASCTGITSPLNFTMVNELNGYYGAVKAVKNGVESSFSNAVHLVIKDSKPEVILPIPTVESVKPNTVAASSTDYTTFVILGSNFTNQMAYQIQGAECKNKRFVSSSQLEMDCKYSAVEALPYSVKVSSNGADAGGNARGTITFTAPIPPAIPELILVNASGKSFYEISPGNYVFPATNELTLELKAIGSNVKHIDVNWYGDNGNNVSQQLTTNGENKLFKFTYPLTNLENTYNSSLGYSIKPITISAAAYGDKETVKGELLPPLKFTLYNYTQQQNPIPTSQCATPAKTYEEAKYIKDNNLCIPFEVYDFWQKKEDGFYLASCNDEINFDAQFKIKNNGNVNLELNEIALTVYERYTNKYVYDIGKVSAKTVMVSNKSIQFPITQAVLTKLGNYNLVARVNYRGQWYNLNSLNFQVYSNRCSNVSSVTIEQKANAIFDQVEAEYGQSLNLGATQGTRKIAWQNNSDMLYRHYPQSGYYAGVDSETESFHYLAPDANKPVSLGSINKLSESLTNNGASNKTDGFETLYEAIHSKDPSKAVTSYFLSKGVGELVSVEISAVVTIFFDKAAYPTISKFLDPKGYKAIEAAFETFASDTSKLKDLGKLVEGVGYNLLFGIIGDELKKNFPADSFVGKVGKEVGIDILMAALKNAYTASKAGSAEFALVWQVGFAADMAGIAIEKNTKALKEGLVFIGAENDMNSSFLAGAILAKSAYAKANELDSLIRTSGASQQEKQIYIDKVNKYIKIAEESYKTTAGLIKSYYVKRGEDYFLTNPYDKLDVNDIESVMGVAATIKEHILFESADARLIIDGKFTPIGTLIYSLLRSVPNEDWSVNDNHVKNQRYLMLRDFLSTFLPLNSLPPNIYGADMEEKLRVAECASSSNGC